MLGYEQPFPSSFPCSASDVLKVVSLGKCLMAHAMYL